MIPNNTPAISRYNIHAIYNGTTWTIKETFNTVGTLTPTGDDLLIQIDSQDNLFKEGKTIVKFGIPEIDYTVPNMLIIVTPGTLTIRSEEGWGMSPLTYNIEIEIFNN